MGKTIDNLREAFEELNKAFDASVRQFNLQGRVLTDDELDFIQLHKEVLIMLNVKRPKLEELDKKFKTIKELEIKLTELAQLEAASKLKKIPKHRYF